MAVEIYLCRDLEGRVVPYDASDKAKLMELKPNTAYRASVVLPRNLERELRQKQWFALAQVIAENSERYANKDQASDAMKIAVGHSEPLEIIRMDGTIERTVRARSIAFKKLSDEEFLNLWAVVKAWGAYMLGCTDEQLESAIAEFFTPTRHRGFA